MQKFIYVIIYAGLNNIKIELVVIFQIKTESMQMEGAFLLNNNVIDHTSSSHYPLALQPNVSVRDENTANNRNMSL